MSCSPASATAARRSPSGGTRQATSIRRSGGWTGTQTPAADGCVSAVLLDVLGAPVAGGAEPALVRFDRHSGAYPAREKMSICRMLETDCEVCRARTSITPRGPQSVAVRALTSITGASAGACAAP